MQYQFSVISKRDGSFSYAPKCILHSLMKYVGYLLYNHFFIRSSLELHEIYKLLLLGYIKFSSAVHIIWFALNMFGEKGAWPSSQCIGPKSGGSGRLWIRFLPLPLHYLVQGNDIHRNCTYLMIRCVIKMRRWDCSQNWWVDLSEPKSHRIFIHTCSKIGKCGINGKFIEGPK
jgi:hypothetical protein